MLHISKRTYWLAAALGLTFVSTAMAAAPLLHKSAELQCADQRVTVEADCFTYVPGVQMCTRQSIRFFGADGKPLGARVFTSTPLKGADYPVVEEQFGELNCVETKTSQKFVVASMGNGGNCEQCEWNDVYSADGTFVGSTRNRKKGNVAVDAAISAAYDKNAKRVLTRQLMNGFYEDGGAK